MKFHFIHAHRHEHTIVKMCKVFGVSTSGYYAFMKRLDRKPTEREALNKKIDQRIQFHFHDHLGCYGSPRVHHELVKEGIPVSKRKVAKRMKELGLKAASARLFVSTTDSNHNRPTYENHLDRNFNPEAPNLVWVTDITYIHTGEGFVYLNPIIDLFSRRIISFRILDHMGTSLCLGALEEALALREPREGLIHHSDQGSQYTSNDYVNALEEQKAIISMSRKGTPYDNACAESFFASLKKEYIYQHAFETKREAMEAINFYIRFYNHKRTHSTLGYLSPIEKEKLYQKEQLIKAKKATSASA